MLTPAIRATCAPPCKHEKWERARPAARAGIIRIAAVASIRPRAGGPRFYKYRLSEIDPPFVRRHRGGSLPQVTLTQPPGHAAYELVHTAVKRITCRLLL